MGMLKHLIYRSIQFLLGTSISRSEYRSLQQTAFVQGKDRLQSLLQYARAHVPYYQQLDVPLPLTLEAFPSLSKTIIRKSFDALKSDEQAKIPHRLNSSGGSTGEPQTFLQDRSYSHWNSLTKAYYFKEFLGVEEARISKILLWGSERDLFGQTRWINKFMNFLTQTVIFNSFKMSEAQWDLCIKTMNARHPVMIRGYAHSLHELAQYINAKKKIVWRPKILYSSAETLWPFMRDEIETVFGVKVHDFYGSREVGPIAGQCRQGMYHLFMFNNWVEIVDAEGKPVEPGKEGRVWVTNLHNRVMPLIRYEIGDTAVLGKQPCACGSRLPTLEKITGRTSDHFETLKGEKVHGEYFTHLFYFQEWVKEFQVRQETKEKISISVVLKGPTNVIPESSKKEIESKIRLVMGDSCAIIWECVQHIPQTPQGKRLFTYSLVA